MVDQGGGTFRAGQYIIEQQSGAGYGTAIIYWLDEEGAKQWVATTTDIDQAMLIVEGLMMVKIKRAHYPQSTPVINYETTDSTTPFDTGQSPVNFKANKSNIPPFLKRKK